MKNLLLAMLLLPGAPEVVTAPVEQPDAAVSYETLLKLNDSPAYRENLDWHRTGGKNEVRISWFLDNRPRLAILCSIQWLQPGQGATVINSREVHGWLKSEPDSRIIIPSKADEVRTVCERPPPSIPARRFQNILIVSVSGEADRAFYVYDRTDLPEEIVRLCEIPDAYVEAGPEGVPLGPKKAWKRKFVKVDRFVAGNARITIQLTKKEVRLEMAKGRQQHAFGWYDFKKIPDHAFAGDIWILWYGRENPGMGRSDEIMLTFQEGKVARIEQRSFFSP